MDQKRARAKKPTIRFFPIRADSNDEKVGAWAAKSPQSLSQSPGLNGSKTNKLTGVTDGHFHGILHDAGSHHPIGPNKKVFKSHTSEFLRDLVLEHFNGQRIWPLENGR